MNPTRLWPAVALATMLLVTACGGGDDAAPVPPGPPVTQRIDATGGKIVLGASGIKTTLDIPAGALSVATSITVSPVPPLAGESARVTVTPSNLRFAQPVSVIFELPSGRTPNRAAAVVQRLNGRSLIRASAIDVAARTVTAQIDVLGQFTRSSARAAARAQALAASAPDTPPDGTLSLQDQADVAARVAEAQAELVNLQVDQSFEKAIVLKLSIAELLQSTGLDGYVAQAEPWLASAKLSACAAFAQASQRASAQVINNLGDYDLFGRGVLAWDAIAQRLGGDPCPGPSADTIMQSMLTQLAGYLTGKVAMPPPATAYPPLANEINAAVELGKEATTLGVAGVEAHTDSLLVQPVVQPLRNAAFATAVQSGDQQAYLPLLAALPDVSELQNDAQYADTTLTLVSRNASGTVLGTVTLGRGVSAGAEVTTATVRADVGGSIELSGNVAVLHCPNAAIERLQTQFEAIPVDDVASVGDALLPSGQTLVHGLPALLASAGIAPATATEATFVVRRAGSSCAQTFGTADATLATVTLDLAPNPEVVLRSAVLITEDYSPTASCPASNGPDGALAYGYAPVTDLSTPLHFAPVLCGMARSSLAIDRPDSNSLVISKDYSAVDTSILDDIELDVTYPQAGTVTMVVNRAWYQNWTGCPVTDGFYTPGYGYPFHEVYLRAVVPASSAPLADAADFKCVIPGRLLPASNVVSFAVAAGQTVRFVLAGMAMRGNDRGSGEQARIVFARGTP